MRELRKVEIGQRGCIYCADVIMPERRYQNRKCPHEECPYHELDNVAKYDEYMKTTNKLGLEKALEALG